MAKSYIGKKARYNDATLRWYLSEEFVDICIYPDGRFDKEYYENAIEHVFIQILIPDYYPGVIVSQDSHGFDVKLEWRERPLYFDRRDIKIKRD